jgi:hypothetical protein
LINIKKDRFYGFKHEPAETWDTMKESPPAVFLPQGDVALAPGQPLYIPTGALPGNKFAGQMLLGDAVAGGIRRIFLEKVNGEYQGAVFFLTGGLEAGPNRMAWGPDGYLYVGMCGQGAGWAYLQDFGLQKIKMSGVEALDIIAIRSRKGGMEIEYSHEINAAAQSAASYTVRSWHYSPNSGYGGAAQQTKTLSVGQVQLSPDKKSVFLPITGLETGKVLHLRMNASIQSTNGKSLWNSESYYTLNAISTTAPFEPSVTLAEPRSVREKKGFKINLASGTMHLSALGSEMQSLEVRDTRGAMVSQSSSLGDRGVRNFQVSTADWKPGLYVVSVKSEGAIYRQRVLIP